MKTLILIVFFISTISTEAFSQHENHTPESSDTTQYINDTVHTGDSTRKMHEHDGNHKEHSMEPMSHLFSRNLPMNRNASGTAWLNDESPMYGYMEHNNGWMYMLHGLLFLRYNNQDIENESGRGGRKFDAPNWLMGMAQKEIGSKGLFALKVMLSLDPLTVGEEGYPLLFQTGETYKGNRLIDRQHPHDLFSELSAAYTHALSKEIDITAYFGYPGEPAFGPVAFMHRTSAMNIPSSPLSHHWQDATHITFGVGTAGIRFGKLKLEGSVFTGREPDENRYNFDKPKFDSYSGRLSYNPTSEIALQISRAFVNSPESIEPDENVHKTTASLLYDKKLNSKKYFSGALIYGNNYSHSHSDNSFLAEGNFQMDRLVIFGRYENVQKSPEELGLALQLPNVEHSAINAFTIGSAYTIFRKYNTEANLGLSISLYKPGKELESFYGKNPVSFEVFIKINPVLMLH